MGKNIVEKILAGHLVYGALAPGGEIGIRIDQTLTQDATGTLAYLQFEAMNVPRVRTELSVSYIDHNTIQIGFENADDHRYLMSVAQKFGIVLSIVIAGALLAFILSLKTEMGFSGNDPREIGRASCRERVSSPV